MPTFAEHLTRIRAEQETLRLGVPPLPTLGPIEGAGAPQSLLDRASEAAKGLGLKALRGLSFAASELAERGREFRGGVGALLFSEVRAGRSARTLANEFIHGRLELEAREFNNLAFGADFMSHIDTLGIPGWTKEIVDPTGILREVPVLSLGKGLDVATEVLVDPFMAVAAAPRWMLAPIGKGVELAAYPLRKAAEPLITTTNPIGAFVHKILDPTLAYRKHPELQRDLLLAGQKVPERMKEAKNTVAAIAKKHGFGWFRRNKDINLPKVMSHLYRRDEALNQAEKGLVDDIVEALKGYRDRLAANGDDHILKIREDIPSTTFGSRITGFGGLPSRVRATRQHAWDPERDLLRPFIPTPKNFVKPAQKLGPTTLKQRAEINLGWRDQPGGKLPFNWDELADSQKDPFHALHMFMARAEERLIWHEKVLEGGRVRGIGFLEKWTLKQEGWRQRGQNSRLEALDEVEFAYHRNMIHKITGHSERIEGIAEKNVMQRFLASLDQHIPGSGRRERIKAWLQNQGGRSVKGFGERVAGLNQNQRVASAMVSNQIVAFLGGNLSSAIKNTSQLLMTAAVKGIPATIKGMFRFERLTPMGKSLQAARRQAGFGDTFEALLDDNVVSAAVGGWKRWLMTPFNFFENFARGTTFNVSVGKAMAKHGVDDLAKLTPALQRQITDDAIIEALKYNFVYGVAGRSEWMSRPVQRMAFTLQSYSWKFLERSATLMARDGGSFTRLAALHGWAIENMHTAAGINAENWLGWGFTPPNALGRGPFVDIALDTAAMITAAARWDSRGVAQAADKLKGNLNQVPRALGLDPDDSNVLSDVAAGLALLGQVGVLPVPTIFVGRTAKLVAELRTGERETSAGAFDRYITPDEALKSYVFTASEDVSRRALRSAEQAVRNQVDGELRKRTKKLVAALKTQDGQRVKEAAVALFQRVPLRKPIPIGSEGSPLLNPGSGLARVFGTRDSMIPSPEMVIPRVQNELLRQSVPRVFREFVEAGWVRDLLAIEFLNVIGDELGAME